MMQNIYPRPSLRREQWTSLDGMWTLNGRQIRVPYPPQSRLSGWEGEVPDRLLYERGFTTDLPGEGQRMLLHFGAVDQTCSVYINGTLAGSHEGGYLPFTFDITDLLKEGRNVIRVEAEDTLSHDYPYGKQTRTPGGMWYTPVSGIWQTVWCETVPAEHIRKITFSTDIHTGRVSWNIDADLSAEAEIVISADGKDIAGMRTGTTGETVIGAEDLRLWTPDDPFLYEVTVRTDSGDEVSTYFAFREYSIEKAGGVNRLCLNGEPVFLNGVLDQGYYPDGIFLPENLRDYDRDICLMKQMGFNTLRKHIKVEPEYFYRACDRLGMIVIQDMVNSGDYSFIKDTALPTVGLKKMSDRKGSRGKREEFFIRHMLDTAEHLDGHPCVAAYTIFNEGWGQFDSDSMYDMLKKHSPDKLIDSASGWFAQEKSDFNSEHVYFREKTLKPGERPMLLSECGGFILDTDPSAKKGPVWGYGRCRTPEQLTEKIEHLYRNMVIPAVGKGLCGCIYTQLSDVENELNGLVSYDRKKLKVLIPRLKELSGQVTEELKRHTKEQQP